MVFIACATDPDDIGYAQLCDPTLQSRGDNYADEAVFERMFPGEGETTARRSSPCFPQHCGEPEVPRRSSALAGVNPIDHLLMGRRGAPLAVRSTNWANGISVQAGLRSGRPAAR